MYYYHCYDESIDKLVDRFSAEWLAYDVNTNIDCLNDIILIHLILRINQDKGIYRKSKLKEYIWDMLSERCNVCVDTTSNNKIDNYRRGFYGLFDYCWKQKFSSQRNGKGAKPIYRIVYRKMPIKRMVIDSNISLILYLLLFVVLFFFIDKWTIEDCSYKWDFESIETHPIAIAIIGLCMLVVFVAINPDKVTIFGPVFCCLLFFLSVIVAVVYPNIMFDNVYQQFEFSSSAIAHLQIQYMKRNIYFGLTCLLLVPMFRINLERLKDHFML